VKKNYLTKISGNFRKDWNKFPEIFRGKFPEISELTTLVVDIAFRRTIISDVVLACMPLCIVIVLSFADCQAASSMKRFH